MHSRHARSTSVKNDAHVVTACALLAFGQGTTQHRAGLQPLTSILAMQILTLYPSFTPDDAAAPYGMTADGFHPVLQATYYGELM